MKVSAAIKIILSYLRDNDIALFTTGMISRYGFCEKDRRSNFYMLGSMGLVSSVGLGIAMNTERKVLIFDGDGSVLMDMGAMAMVAYHQPPALYHIVLDNECYHSTGGQPTLTTKINLAHLAKAAGYRKVLQFSSAKELRENIRDILNTPGPVFILINARDSEKRIAPRVSISPRYLAQRLKKELLDAGK